MLNLDSLAKNQIGLIPKEIQLAEFQYQQIMFVFHRVNTINIV